MDQFLAMRAFVGAVKMRNLGRAAEVLGISRPLVTRQIQALEESLNSHLMIRTTRSLTLTAAGEKYFLFCEEMLAQVDEMAVQMRNDGHEVRGILPVLCPKWLAEPVTASLVEFSKLHPDIRPKLMLESSPLTAYEFLSRGCEVSLNSRPIPDSRIIARKLFDLPYVLCASPEFLATIAPPNAPSELGNIASLVQPSFPQWTFSSEKNVERILPKSVFSANSYIALREATRGGLGLATIPKCLVQDDLNSGRLVSVMSNWDCETQAVYVSSAPRKTSTVRAQVLTKFLAKWFRANPV